ncbi:MAG: hypothetical protein ACLFN8_02500 [Candidatus Woesearchaeota archaeon]
MNSKKINKMLFILAIVVIIISILGTFLITNNLPNQTLNELEQKDSTTGTISLNIAKEPQEYASSGKISLDIINKENSEE